MDNPKQLKKVKNFDPGSPRYSCVLINRSCPLQCKMCLNWKNPAEDPAFKFSNFRKYIKSLAEFVDYPIEINIMGGEPLMEGWVFDLIEAVYDYGFTSIISTNAYLINDEMAKNIMNSPLKVLGISLESFNRETHDFYRGKKGVTDKVLQAIKLLEKHKRPDRRPVVDILTLFLKKNLDEIIDLVKGVDKSNFIGNVAFSALLNSVLPEKTEKWHKKEEYKDLWPSDSGKVAEIIDELINMKKNGSRIVNPISQLEAFKEYYKDPVEFIYTTPYSLKDLVIEMEASGELYLSGHRLGNINDSKTLRELYYSKEAQEIRDKISKFGWESARSALINFICVFPPDTGCKLKSSAILDNSFKQRGRVGFFYQQQGDYKKAIDNFKEALKSDPKNVNLRVGIAFNYLKLKDYKSAVREYKEVFRLNPDYREAFADYKEALNGIAELNNNQG